MDDDEHPICKQDDNTDKKQNGDEEQVEASP
jgi:hypothetical protein